MAIAASPCRGVLGLALLAAACAGLDDRDMDDGEADCPEEMVRLKNTCLAACPERWQRGPDNRCRPPCLETEDLVDGTCERPCPEGMIAADENRCVPLGSTDAEDECPVDLYGDVAPRGEAVYVDRNADVAASDGSRAAPFATMAAAVSALSEMTAPEVTVYVAAGEYDIGELRVDSTRQTTLSFVGRCAEKTRFTAARQQPGLSLVSKETAYGFHGIEFHGGDNLIMGIEVAALSIDHCRFSDWSGSAAVMILHTFALTVRDADFLSNESWQTNALDFEAEIAEISDSRFDVTAEAGFAVYGTILDRIAFTGNRVSGRGTRGAEFTLEQGTRDVVFQDNAFEGNWGQAGLGLHAEDRVTTAHITLENTHILNHTSVGERTGTALTLMNLADTTIDDLRVGRGNVNAVYIDNPGKLAILDSTFADTVLDGVYVAPGTPSFDTCSISVRRSRFIGVEAYAIFHDNAACELVLEDNVFQDNEKGVFVKANAFTADGNDMGAVDDTAIAVTEVHTLSIGHNTIASIAAAGIALSSLNGGTDDIFSVEDNRISDCQGAGVFIDGTGDGWARLRRNDIVGTRPEQHAGKGGFDTTADGVRVSSESDTAKTRVEITENTIAWNYRLGVLLNGPGTVATVSENRFSAGNGYGGVIPATQSETCDLLTQAGAAVSGSDERQAESVRGVYVGKIGP